MIAATNELGIVIVAAIFLVAGYLLVGAGWYLMVLRPSRRERAQAAGLVAGTTPAERE